MNARLILITPQFSEAIKFEREFRFKIIADLFKIFGDSTRVRILWALNESEMCVCDISALLNMTQSAISHQLRLLKQSNLVKNRKDGKVVYYSIKDEHVKDIFSQGFLHIREK